MSANDFSHAPLILLDDDRGRFGPITDLRAAFEIRSGADSTARRIARWAASRLGGLWAPPGLAEVVRPRASVPVNVLPEAPTVALLSGRLLLPDEHLRPALGQVLLDAHGEFLAALLRPVDAGVLLAALPEAAAEQRHPGPTLEEVARSFGGEPIAERNATLAGRPWDLLDALPRTIAWDALAERPRLAREPGPAVVIGDHPVIIDSSARIWPGVVIDAEQGAVIVRERAVIRPHATLTGPCAVGEGATVLDHASIRQNTVIGPMCKVAGEVSGTIFQGFANKAHDGFLGDTYIGKWVNVGAGTTGSNLLNTYGEVSMRLDAAAHRERTGRRFLGAIVGDHTKLAIGTRLMTGTVIGTGAMIAVSTPPPMLTPPFCWLTDDASDGSRRWRFDRFEETMRATMARRGREPTAPYLERLRFLHARATSA